MVGKQSNLIPVSSCCLLCGVMDYIKHKLT